MLISHPGHYLYIESSYPARFEYKSQLMSQSFEPTEAQCLSWWFSMYGRTVGSLNVYLINSTDGAKTRLWTRSGQQGKDWQQAHVSYSSETKYRVSIWIACKKAYSPLGAIAVNCSGGRGVIVMAGLILHLRNRLRWQSFFFVSLSSNRVALSSVPLICTF